MYDTDTMITHKAPPPALLIMMSSAGSSPLERSEMRETNTGTTGTTVRYMVY